MLALKFEVINGKQTGKKVNTTEPVAEGLRLFFWGDTTETIFFDVVFLHFCLCPIIEDDEVRAKKPKFF